ncbi:MAG TPA: hypothetical protein GX401_03255 [Clostridiales bacterium]|nr:hypothetical protein [Clostridiales bacterium]
MKADIIKRINALHEAVQKAELPDMVFIEPKDGKWEVTEQFFGMKKNASTDIKYNTFLIDHYGQYKAPEGFKGVIIIDDLMV